MCVMQQNSNQGGKVLCCDLVLLIEAKVKQVELKVCFFVKKSKNH